MLATIATKERLQPRLGCYSRVSAEAEVRKKADLGAKRLIGLAPDGWVRWVTGLPDAAASEVLASEFQWIERASGAVIRAYAPACGEFLVVSELQLRYTSRMPVRLRAYAALGEVKYGLRAYPVLVNILPPAPGTVIVDRYESDTLGLKARQDYRVINLWEVDVNLVFERPLPTLLPFVPVLRGGAEEPVISRALHELRADDRLCELEPLLGFFATFVLDSELVQRIVRWDMAVLLESPIYQQILREGEQIGVLMRAREDVIENLVARFGVVPRRTRNRILAISDGEVLKDLHRKAVTLPSLKEFERALDTTA